MYIRKLSIKRSSIAAKTTHHEAKPSKSGSHSASVASGTLRDHDLFASSPAGPALNLHNGMKLPVVFY
jgi:hypothetical protein